MKYENVTILQENFSIYFTTIFHHETKFTGMYVLKFLLVGFG